MRHLAVILFILLVVCNSEMVSQSCLPDGITFTTQSQIDSFQILYPNCTEIEGDVKIQGNDIKKLEGLSSLNSIGGTLRISFNDSLNNLSGLDSLIDVGHSLTIYANVSLQHLHNLNKLTSIGYELNIWHNHSLCDLVGLENISHLGGLSISGNDSLASLIGLENVSIIYGNVFFQHNELLASLSGLDNLEVINGELDINITNFTSLDGLNRLKRIGWDFRVSNNYQLSEVNALDSLSYIDGGVNFTHNTSLVDISGLANLDSIGGNLWIHDSKLQNFNPLINLSSIDGELRIQYNDELNSLEGLNNIEPSSIAHLGIIGNTNLSYCEIQSVCDYLQSPNGNTNIENNAIGCNSPEEVLDSCIANSVYINEQVLQDIVKLYPNPFTTSTTIEYELTKPTHIQLTIFNHLGEAVEKAVSAYKLPGVHTYEWSAERLSEGMYFAVLRNWDGVSVIKMIKQ